MNVALSNSSHLDKAHLHAWFTTLFANTPSALLVFDKHGKLLDCNERFSQLVQVPRDRLLGLDLKSIDDSRVLAAVCEVLKGEIVQLELDYSLPKQGKTVPLKLYLNPVRYENEMLGGVGIVEDLSEKFAASHLNERQLAFEKMVAKISKQLVNASIDELDQTIELILARIGNFFDVDRCYVFQYDAAGIHFSNTHEWCAADVSSQMAARQNLARADFPWIHSQIDAQLPIHLANVAELGDDVSDERDFMLAQEIQSLLVIPMLENGKLIGLLGIDSVRHTYHWPNDKIILLEVVAETISNAILRRSFEKALSRINQQYQQFSSQVPLGLYTLRLDSNNQVSYEYCNRQFLDMNGVDSLQEDLVLKHIHPEDLVDFEERQQFALKNHKAFVWEGRYLKHNQVRWMRIEDSEPDQADNGDWIWSGFQQDITDRKELEERLKELATVDDMTQLWNRRYFMLACDDEFERAQRYDSVFSFLMVDADHFKAVNDHYGHAAGDAVLVNLASVMSESVRKVDFVGRLGGEEFAILLPSTPEGEAELLAERIRKAVQDNPADYKGQSLPITISIGITSYRLSDQELDQVIQRADKALYEAKNQGRNRCMTAKP